MIVEVLHRLKPGEDKTTLIFIEEDDVRQEMARIPVDLQMFFSGSEFLLMSMPDARKRLNDLLHEMIPETR